jgi:hypothetical protein
MEHTPPTVYGCNSRRVTRGGRINLTDLKKECRFVHCYSVYQEAFVLLFTPFPSLSCLFFFNVYFAMRAQWKSSHPK